MKIKDAKNIRIDEFLENLGFQCAKVSGGRKWYCAPWRNEKTPSFVLSQDGYAWYDHGEGVGGNILDFTIRYADLRDVSEALGYIERAIGNSYVIQPPRMEYKKMEPELPAYVVESAPQFSGNGKGAEWLKSRGINPEVMRPYLSEVYFNRREKPLKKPFYGIGIATRSEGFEVRTKLDRNHWMKSSVGHKDISVFKSKYNPENKWVVAEGVPDFGSFLTLNPTLIGMRHFLILNSTAMTGRAIEYLVTQEPGYLGILSQRGKAATDSQEKLEDFASNNGWDGGHYNDMFMNDDIDFDPSTGELIGPSDLNEWHMRKLGMARGQVFKPEIGPNLSTTPKLKM